MKPVHEVVMGNEKLRESCIKWMNPVAHSGYLADPAGFFVGEVLHILAEDYSYATQKACISEITRESDSVSINHRIRIIKGDNHLSYPYVVEDNGEVYCLPESFQSSGITLYRRDPASGAFTKFRTLLDNVQAVDPTLFFYRGIWWLFYTEMKYSNTHLHLYYSTGLTGDFKPHRLNPVKTDIRSARPAGTPFIHDDVLYCPAQDCSETYGGRVAINKVLRLTPDDFAEETVNFIEPAADGKYNQGLRTISSVGSYTLIDGKRYQWSFQFLKHQLQDKRKRKGPGNV